VGVGVGVSVGVSADMSVGVSIILTPRPQIPTAKWALTSAFLTHSLIHPHPHLHIPTQTETRPGLDEDLKDLQLCSID